MCVGHWAADLAVAYSVSALFVRSSENKIIMENNNIFDIWNNYYIIVEVLSDVFYMQGDWTSPHSPSRS